MNATVVAVPARKGDLILVEKTRRDYVIGQGTQARTTFEFGVVASATRDGAVKTWRAVGWGDSLLSESARPIGYDDRRVLPASEIDVDGVLHAAKAHHWDGHPGQPKPFESLEDARECARPFRSVSSC